MDLEINGFRVPIHLDREAATTGKSMEDGVRLYISELWCDSVTVRVKFCAAYLELLSVSLRPHYLPQEFPQLCVTLV